LWAGIPFLGGIGGFQNAPCGIVSSTAVCLGFRYRSPLDDKERVKQARHAIRNFSGKLVNEFNQAFGDITCLGLIGMDFSKPGVYKEFLESGIWKEKCEKYMEFMIGKLYALEENKGLFVLSH
ncbi:MAG: C-GCAxxG-C-C family protein, partial [Proteobacteria bacterium]|nr:C-GCAxxG-C-C family protein [Pseudomonadota bacterium]